MDPFVFKMFNDFMYRGDVYLGFELYSAAKAMYGEAEKVAKDCLKDKKLAKRAHEMVEFCGDKMLERIVKDTVAGKPKGKSHDLGRGK